MGGPSVKKLAQLLYCTTVFFPNGKSIWLFLSVFDVVTIMINGGRPRVPITVLNSLMGFKNP